ncbi:MAG: OmpH family outer membrane protein, partial [Gemmatimonadetes bacterium]|nr:OmpH family outer membrane protein [Gemmatimonadota bacterium]
MAREGQKHYSRREFLMTRCRLLYVALSLALTGIASTAGAELKLGYIDSQKILDQYKPYQDALREFNRYEEELQREISTMQNDLAKMQDTYERQSLLLSDKRKQEEQQAILKKQQELQRFVQDATSPQGRLARKTAELSEPIIQTVNAVIKQVAEDEDFDFVLNSTALA